MMTLHLACQWCPHQQCSTQHHDSAHLCFHAPADSCDKVWVKQKETLKGKRSSQSLLGAQVELQTNQRPLVQSCGEICCWLHYTTFGLLSRGQHCGACGASSLLNFCSGTGV
eukprot:2344204-Amphidinium_carterae.1